MTILQRMLDHDFEQVMYCFDEVSGLRAIIGVHDTTLGPAIGGLRCHPYVNEDQALDDVLRLSRAMTLKASAAGLNHGGGCAIICGDPATIKSEALLRSFGRNVESLGGRFVVGQDVGTIVEDMETISLETQFVCGLRKSRGGSGDPTEKAAYGVLRGIQACLEFTFGESSLRNRTIAIQGVGAVGRELARLVSEEGAMVLVADKNPKKIARIKEFLDCRVVPPEEILSIECDVLAPCAMGGVLTPDTIPHIKARIVAGSANSQLSCEEMADELFRRGIVYAPDFVINAGGLINVAEELSGYDEQSADMKVGRLFSRIKEILGLAQQQQICTNAAAKAMAMERIRQIREVRRTFLPGER